MIGTRHNGPIPTPLKRRVTQLRQSFMPLCAWVGAIAALSVLAERQGEYVALPGTAELRTVAVAPLIDGTVQSISKDIFDSVEAGEVIALMDDTLVTAELRVAEAELSRQRSLLEAERRRFEMEWAGIHTGIEDDLRRFILDDEDARLDYLDRLVEQESNRVRVQRLGIQLTRFEKLLTERLIDEAIYDETRTAHDSLRERIAENEAALALAAERREWAGTRLSEARALAVETPEIEAFLTPIRNAVSAQEARIAEVSERRLMLALRAPFDGQVSQVLRRTGETVLSGTPLLMLSDPKVRRVVAYLDETTAFLPEIGQAVEVVSRRAPRRVLPAEVIKVGYHIEEMPKHLWSSPFSAQRGIPVLLGNLIGNNNLLPGETVDVRIKRGAAPAKAGE